MKNVVFVIAFTIFGISFIALCFAGYAWSQRPFDVRYTEVRFEVSQRAVGFDLNSSALTFGRVIPGSASVRTIRLDNTYSFPVTVHIFLSPSLQGYVTTPQAHVILEPYGHVRIPFTLTIPHDSKAGNYTGLMRLEFRR